PPGARGDRRADHDLRGGRDLLPVARGAGDPTQRRPEPESATDPRAGAGPRRGVRAAAAVAAAVVGLAAASCAAQPTGYPPPTPLPAQPSCAVETEPAPLCVLVLGDSTAAGVPLTGSARWWEQLDRQLVAGLPGRQVEVDSWAVPSSRIDVLESAA